MTKPDSAISFKFVAVVVFIAGIVLMSLEIAGSRILAPYFGSTIFVWASLISVFLAALAFGYFLGGTLADHIPSQTILGCLIGAAGIFIFLVPFIGKWVNPFLSGTGVGDQAGSLLASLMIFFIPSLLLGMVSPFAVKLCVRDLSTVGNTMGRMYAISALGNIFGTLFTAFFLINIIGVPYIFAASGLLLVGVSLFIFLREHKRGFFLLGILFFGLGLVEVPARAIPSFIAPNPSEDVLLQKDSFYNQVVVLEDRKLGLRKLVFDGMCVQTAVSLSGNHASPYPTEAMMHLPVAFVPDLRRVLVLGAGGGVTPRNYVNDYPGIKVDVVEIDPLIVKISKDFFYFQETENLKVFNADGRRFVRETQTSYDLVLMDVFNAASRVPFHMLTKEFFQELDRKLTPDGVVAINFICPEGGVWNELFLAINKTLGAVFKNVYVVPNVLSDYPRDFAKRMNIVLIATKSGDFIPQAQLYTRIRSSVDGGKIKFKNLEEYAWITHTVVQSVLGRIPVLTDNYAPAERLYTKKHK